MADELPLSLTAGQPYDPRPGHRPWETGPPGEQGHYLRDEGYRLPDHLVPPGQTVLRNLTGALSEEHLAVEERAAVLKATAGLHTNPPQATFDRTHLQTIHARLFGHVYPWAGELRTVPIVRGVTDGDQPAPFIPPEQLDQSL